VDLLPTLAAYAPTASLAAIGFLMLVAGGVAVAWPLLAGGSARQDVKRRLHVETGTRAVKAEAPSRRNRAAVRENAVKTAQDFYARTDPENVARLRLKLIQAGYMDPRAVGAFFLIRFGTLIVVAIVSLVALTYSDKGYSDNRWMLVLMAAAGGYFLPGLVLARMIKTKLQEYRDGFPDFMDLMIVCADAGMSMEAAIERVSKELAKTYPSLSENLQLVSIELRAGRNLEDALKALADRLSLDEVRSFAILLQQSRELGTSLSGALRVFSDEMRHKRMSMAEEKAHALPAKMSVPVTVCILPVVLMVAIIPILVRMTAE
jgi:tight adherence protein C